MCGYVNLFKMQGFYLILILGVLLSGTTLAVIEEDLQGLNISGFEDISSNITSKLPSAEDAEKVFAEKCRKNGGEEAYEKTQKAKNETMECVKNLVNFEELQKEMEIAKPSGDLDSVFNKYCKKSPDLVKCVEKFTTDIEPCLEEEEKKSKNVVVNVTSQLVEFICHKQGDRIALFIAEGGPECLNASQKGINDCFQTIYKKHVPENEKLSLGALPVLIFQAEQCEEFSRLQHCVVRELEKCKDQTPGNVIDSLFNYVRKVTPCSNFEEISRTTTSDAESVNPTQFAVGFLLNYFVLRHFA